MKCNTIACFKYICRCGIRYFYWYVYVEWSDPDVFINPLLKKIPRAVTSFQTL